MRTICYWHVLKNHLPDNLVKEIQRVLTLAVLDRSPYKLLNVDIKQGC